MSIKYFVLFLKYVTEDGRNNMNLFRINNRTNNQELIKFFLRKPQQECIIDLKHRVYCRATGVIRSRLCKYKE